MLSHWVRNMSAHATALHVRTFLHVPAPQETPSPPLPTYSLVNHLRNKKTISIPSYVEPENDYDDIEIPVTAEDHHSNTVIPSTSKAQEGLLGLFGSH